MTTQKTTLEACARATNAALETILPPSDERPARLHQAMRHSIFSGGKRLRSALCMSACEACGASASDALQAACALELLHTYTLIHDDLPAMDDDTLRRGRPTCHIAFDEATAILAGDALLTLSFEVLAGLPEIGCALALELARATGSRGVIAGQAEDLAAEGQAPDADRVEYIHLNKTAALIRAACVMGGLCARADANELRHLTDYGQQLGLAFQLIDDLLDESATEKELGKNIGSDRNNGKMTWPAVHGVSATRRRARQLTDGAMDAAQQLPNGQALLELAQRMAARRA